MAFTFTVPWIVGISIGGLVVLYALLVISIRIVHLALESHLKKVVRFRSKHGVFQY